MAFNGSQTFSTFKSPLKTDLEYTRYTTYMGTTQGNTTHFGAKQSKIDQAYWKARSLIDELIMQVQEKRDMSRMAVKAIGDTNEYIEDTWNFESDWVQQGPENVSAIQPNPYEQQIISEIDFEKLELLKIIQGERLRNYNLQRKYKQLNDENAYLRESQLGYPRHQPLQSPVQKYFVPVYQPAQPFLPRPLQMNQGTRQLFAQLQNLKEENQRLRQETIKLLKSSNY